MYEFVKLFNFYMKSINEIRLKEHVKVVVWFEFKS